MSVTRSILDLGVSSGISSALAGINSGGGESGGLPSELLPFLVDEWEYSSGVTPGPRLASWEGIFNGYAMTNGRAEAGQSLVDEDGIFIDLDNARLFQRGSVAEWTNTSRCYFGVVTEGVYNLEGSGRYAAWYSSSSDNFVVRHQSGNPGFIQFGPATIENDATTYFPKGESSVAVFGKATALLNDVAANFNALNGDILTGASVPTVNAAQYLGSYATVASLSLPSHVKGVLILQGNDLTSEHVLAAQNYLLSKHS